MKNITIIKDDYGIDICEVTEYLDSIMPNKPDAKSMFRNHIRNIKPTYDNRYEIVYPCITIGHIKVDDNNMVIDVKIYEDEFCEKVYDTDIKELNKVLKNKFIGSKVVVE